MVPPRLPVALVAVIFVAVYLLGAIAFRWTDSIHWHDSQRIAQFILYCVLAALAIPSRPLIVAMVAQAGRLPPAVAPMLVVWLGLGVLSAVTSGFPRYSLLEVSLLAVVPLFATIVMVARDRTEEGFDRIALGVVVLAGAVIAGPFLVAYAASVSTDVGFFPQFLYASGFSNPRFLGQFHTMVLPLLALACFWKGLPPRYRYAAFVVLVLTWVMALLTATRATWFSCAGAMLFVAVLAPAVTFRLLKVQIAALAIAWVSAWVMFELLPAYLHPGAPRALDAFAGRFADPLGLSLRDILWMRAIELAGAHPWLGVGPMGLALDLNMVGAHPHNAPLQLAAEWGIPAAVAIGLAVSLLGLRFSLLLARSARIQSRSSKDDLTAGAGPDVPLAAALLSSLASAAVSAMVDGLIVMPYTQVMLCAVLGWTAAVLLPATREPASTRSQDAGYRGMAVVIGLFVAALAWGIGPHLRGVSERGAAFETAFPDLRQNLPRLWVQGWLVDQVRTANRLDLSRVPVAIERDR
jgi:hypothetical protein